MNFVEVNGYAIALDRVRMVSAVYSDTFLIDYPHVFVVYFENDVRKVFSFASEEAAKSARETLLEQLNETV